MSLFEKGVESEDMQSAIKIAEKFLEAKRLKEVLKKHFSEINVLLPLPDNAKLNETEINEIYSLYQSGLYTQLDLANQYVVRQPAISKIVRKNETGS